MGGEAVTELVSIVGVSRSGTSLMRNILDRSRELAVADENYFIGHLVERDGVRHRLRRLGDLDDDRVIERAVDFIYSGELRRRSFANNWGYWRWLRDNVPREDLITALQATDRSDRELFLAFLRRYAEHQGKPLVGEKTPAHFLYVDTILDWFPDGRVIQMVRDPRGNYHSEVTRRRTHHPHRQPLPFRLARRSDVLLKLVVLGVVASTWIRAARRIPVYRARYPDRFLVVRFEDLVSDQRTTVERVCRFLDTPFCETMLDQRVVRGRQRGRAGIDRSASDRWRGEIDPWVDRSLQRAFGPQLRELGYA